MSLLRTFAGTLLIVAAHADGQQVAGPKWIDCPPGQMLVQVSLGSQPIYKGCFSAAELERAGYKTMANEVVCRTLIVKSN